MLKENFPLHPAQRAYCSALSLEPDIPVAQLEALARLAGEDVAARRFAEQNELDGILGHAVSGRSEAGRQEILSGWARAHENNLQRLQAYMGELDAVANLLQEAGIQMVALKNAGIARGLHPCPGCCPMGDIDLLVRKEDFRAAHRLILERGFRFEFRSPLERLVLEEAERSGGSEYWRELDSGERLWMELQWRPVAGRWLRPDQEPSGGELIARSVPVEGTAVRLLAPEDNLLQVCLHTAKHSFVRAPGFRLHLDVHRIVRCNSIDWKVFLRRVSEMQIRTPVYFSLLLPAELLGTAVPDFVLAELEPVPWKKRVLIAMLNRAGLFNPDERKFDRWSYILFNALLYDDMMGFLRGVFPASDWMKAHYGFSSDLMIPYYYGRRLCNLLFKRLKT